jgi:hypothetical protein
LIDNRLGESVIIGRHFKGLSGKQQRASSWVGVCLLDAGVG